MNDVNVDVTHENNESVISARKKVKIEITVEPEVTPEEEEQIKQIAKEANQRVHTIVNGGIA